MSKNYRQARICVEKIPMAHQQKMQQAKQAGSSPAHMARLRAAFLKDNIWPAGARVTICFINGKSNAGNGSAPPLEWTPLAALRQSGRPLDPLETKLRDQGLTPQEVVKKVVKERIIPLVGLRIAFVDPPSANVRVAFDTNDGAWAYVGTDQLTHKDTNEATVNLGWLDVGTIIHEFCHVLGMIHEHQNPRGKQIDWDDRAVYTWAQQTQGWSHETTDENILDRYKIAQLNSSDFDPLSIMLYFFPADLTENNQGTKQNMRYSGVDVEWIGKMYGKNAKETPTEFYPEIYGESLEDAIHQSEEAAKEFREGKGKLPKHFWLIVGIILAILVIGGLIWYFLKNRKSGRRYGYGKY